MKRLHHCIFLVLLFNIYDKGAAQKIAYAEKKIIITNGDWQLKGNLLLVHNGKKSPIVLMLNKANGDRTVYENLSKQLAEKQISSLRIDLRGHGESINKGKFIPFDSANNSLLDMENTYTDIIEIQKYILSIPDIDTTKVGIVGASYSGEEMMIASRKFRYAKSYIALSPGSFSDESISCIDSLKTSMLFIKSYEERSMKEFENDLFSKAKNAKIIIVAGKAHATDLLITYPDLNAIIANWFVNHL